MTSELTGYSDDDLLLFLNAAREQRGRLEEEVARRFRERNVTVIESEHFVATQRQDTERCVSLTKKEDKSERPM